MVTRVWLAMSVCQIGPSRSREMHGMSKRKRRKSERTDEETVRKHASKKPPRQLSGRAAGAPTTSAASRQAADLEGGNRRRVMIHHLNEMKFKERRGEEASREKRIGIIIHVKCLRRDARAPVELCSSEISHIAIYRGLYVVARNLFLLLLNCSAWPCLGPV